MEEAMYHNESYVIQYMKVECIVLKHDMLPSL